MLSRKALVFSATTATLGTIVMLAGGAAPPLAEQPGGDKPPKYLVDEKDLPAVAEKFGLDEEGLARLRKAHHALAEHQAHPKPDPVKANGEVFANWPKPDAAIVFTGEQIGYLEPCGCAGLENQKGGLKRRHTMVRTLRDKWGWPLALFDAGEQVRSFGPQSDIKHRRTIEALIEIGYQAVGFGVKDLRTEVLGMAINLDEATNPLTSANVGLLDFDSGFSKRWRVIEVGEGKSVRIGVTQVIAKSGLAEVSPSDDILTIDPEQALKEIEPQIKADACDQNVLMVYGTPDEARELAKKFDLFDWVVAARGADEPPHMLDESTRIEGTTRGGGSQLIEVGHKGMYAVVIGLYRSKDATPANASPGEGWDARYQRTPLDHRWADSPQMVTRLAAYQAELEQLGWEGLGLTPAEHPTTRDFAGSDACRDCHTAAWEVFEKTPHYHTTETLVALQPARHFDPECIACHSVGWEPQKYYPFKTGWVSYSETPDKYGQGCENCHGPAARHVAVENGEIEVDEAEELALRKSLHLEIGENEGNKTDQKLGQVVNNCLSCHDIDNSPDFDFQKYWPKVAHKGLD